MTHLVVNHQKLDYVTSSRTAYITKDGVVIAEITEDRNDAGEFCWVIKPYYDVIDRIGFIDISGINLDLRLEAYYRQYIPSFVDERTLPDNRVNLHEELEKLGLTWNDRFEFMCRTGGICGPSNLRVSRTK